MLTSSDRFFGYGSLVNTATHAYVNPKPATVRGWRRHWVQSSQRDVAFLSVTPDPLSAIDGLVAEIGDIGWDKLDEREAAYDRLTLTSTMLSTPAPVQMYRASPTYVADQFTGKPILLSYLDCVVQGFHQNFGEDGVRRFFRSTSGWNTPVRNDRAAPQYPRAQSLDAGETALVDQYLSEVAATVIPNYN